MSKLAALTQTGRVLKRRVSALAFEGDKHPRGKTSAKSRGGSFAPKAGGGFVPIAEEFIPGRLQQEDYNASLLTPEADRKIQDAYTGFNNLWESPNGRLRDDMSFSYVTGSKNVSLNFGGRVYNAFIPRRGEEDDDHPNVNRPVFDKVASRLEEIAKRHFPGAKITVGPSEKYYIDVRVRVPADKVLKNTLTLT